ncbi:Uncharacterized protein FWK35_00031497, partial [Aphis craccivora]
MFGTKAQRGLLTSSLSREQIEKLATEEKLEQILQSITPQTDPENKGNDENEVEEESNGKSDDNLDNQANNDEDKLSDKSNEKNQNELLNINERKKNTIKNRALALNGLQSLNTSKCNASIVEPKISACSSRNKIWDYQSAVHSKSICSEKLISLSDVLSNKTMSLRQVSTAASKSAGQ